VGRGSGTGPVTASSPDGSSNSSVIDVVAAVITRSDGSFLLAQRPAGKVYAGWWEFPGGKVEPAEGLLDALSRELCEELGIVVERAHPWITRRFVYPHASVRLHFFRVMCWHGEPHGHEDQTLAWQRTGEITVEPLLPANAPVLRALALPPVYGVSAASALGKEPFLARLDAALAGGLRLVQVREKEMAPGEFADFARRIVHRAHRFGAKVLLNADAAIAFAAGADGIQVAARRLMQTAARPGLELVGASCHDPQELARAAQLELDFVLLGPVLATPSHPDTHPLGWSLLAEWIRDYPLPVYAIGGMGWQDLETAWAHGAHGIAMMRAAWQA
jgi:8-oxo-dGTP diphosphatase